MISLAGLFYRIKRIKTFFFDIIINEIAASYLCPICIRILIFKLFNFTSIKGPIHAKCYFGSGNIIIGKNTYINRGCFFDNENGALIEIGDDCAIGYNVSFLTTNHDVTNPVKRSGKVISDDIKIENGCWIGAHVIILPGITIKTGCVIAAGSIITKDTEQNSLYAGIPAKKIKDL